MKIHNNLLSLIGNTPMVELHQFDTGPCRLFMKLEYYNPGGSIKDRIARSMIEAAEKNGDIKPGDTLIEATAGNTGLGLALLAILKGYQLILVLPDKMSHEKIEHLQAMGVETIITRSDVEKGHPEYYQDMALRLSKENDYYYVNQFANPANPLAHETTTGPEIWQQMEGNIDAFVYGVGSSGGMTGVGRFLKRKNPSVDLVLADPEGSILADLINTGKHDAPGKWLVEGIGEDFVPSICDLEHIDTAYSISDKDSMLTVRDLLTKEGIFAGSSTGTHLFAALKYCRAQTEPKRVVTVACDSGNKYMSKAFNDTWMREKGFLS